MIFLETNLGIIGANIRKQAETNFIGLFILPIALLPFAHVTRSSGGAECFFMNSKEKFNS